MKIEELIKGKIKSLEDYIELVETDLSLKIDKVDYEWAFCGTSDNYEGRLNALKELLKEL